MQRALFASMQFFAFLPGWSKRLVLLAADMIVAPLALMLALGVIFSDPTPFAAIERLWPLLPFVAICSGLVSVALGLHMIKLKSYETRAVMITGAGACLLALALFLFCGALGLPLAPGAVILFGLLHFLGSVAARGVMLQALLWVLRADQPRCRVIIYGAGATGAQLAAALKSHNSIVPVAFVDDNPALQGMTIAGLRVHAPDRLVVMTRKMRIDRVLMAMPSVSAPKQAKIARRLERLGVDVFAVPSFAQLAGTEAIVDALAPITPGALLGRTPVDPPLPDGTAAYRGKVILVTGAGGSIGAEICRQLLDHEPAKIILMEISEVALYAIDRELCQHPRARMVRIIPVLGSVTDSRITRAVIGGYGVQVVLHAAAYKHVPLVESNPIAGMKNNVIGTRVLADAAAESAVERFILISTDKAVRPSNMMGASKRLAEMVAQDMAKRSQKTVFSMVRFGNVLGSSGSVVPLFNEQIARGGPVTVTHPEVSRYFMTIAEAVRLVLLAGSFDHSGQAPGGDVFVLDMGAPMKIIDLARQMIEASGYTVRDAQNPDGDIDIEIVGLRPGEKLHEELLIGEGLLTTPHPKILRAREGSLTELDTAVMLKDLGRVLALGDAEGARALAERYVEGFREQKAFASGAALPAE